MINKWLFTILVTLTTIAGCTKSEGPGITAALVSGFTRLSFEQGNNELKIAA
jgi:hypothetical protein